MGRYRPGQRQIGFYLDIDLYDKVISKVYGAKYDRTMSECIRALLWRWVRDEISLEAKHVKPPEDLYKAKRY